MFDVSFWELLIIGAIALVVVGPERLPRLMRTLGLWAGRARASFQSLRDEVEREVNADGLKQTREALNRQAKETEREINEAVDVKGDGAGTSDAGAGPAKSASEAAADGQEPPRAAGAPEQSPVRPPSSASANAPDNDSQEGRG